MNHATEERRNVEYEEAPSGNIIFYQYKEPLMKFTGLEGEGGHGFVGALVFDGESEKIQCHLCGEWFDSLGHHLNREHAMSAARYKEIVGLNKKTALINEKIRAKLIAKGLEARMKNLRQNRRKRHPEQKYRRMPRETRLKIAETLRQNREENKNLRGTCPEQLIERLVTLYQKLGRTPTNKEIPFLEALKKTYGTLRESCTIAGIPYRPPGVAAVPRNKYPEGFCINWVRDFFDANGRLPTSLDCKATKNSWMWTRIVFYGKDKIFRLALAMDGRYRKQSKIFRYTKDELLNFLVTFAKINGRKPSYSDAKRGLIPNLSRYSYNFGSWQNALKEAFPTE